MRDTLAGRASTALGIGKLNLTEARVKLQDKFARIKNLENRKGLTDTAIYAYQAESLYYGKTGFKLNQLKKQTTDPLVAEMAKRGISAEAMGEYLYARHAPERNLKLGILYNPGHDFHDAITHPDTVGASGMSATDHGSPCEDNNPTISQKWPPKRPRSLEQHAMPHRGAVQGLRPLLRHWGSAGGGLPEGGGSVRVVR